MKTRIECMIFEPVDLNSWRIQLFGCVIDLFLWINVGEFSDRSRISQTWGTNPVWVVKQSFIWQNRLYSLSKNILILSKICKWFHCFEWVCNESFSVKLQLSFTDWIKSYHNIGNVYKHWICVQYSQIYFSGTSTIIFCRKMHEN